MNLQQFSALKTGDQIENTMTNSRGTITETNAVGVRVRWGNPTGAFNGFMYSVQSTAWFHWNKMEDSLDDALIDELAHPPKSIMKP